MNRRKFFIVFAMLGLFFIFSNPKVWGKDEWLAVRSKNFNLIGNAGKQDIRGIAVKLEQFREVFRRTFDKINFNSPVPTTVFVFREASAFNLFKPLNAGAPSDQSAAAYFLAGEDGNYIMLSTEGDPNQSLEKIFHQYAHFLVDNNIGKSIVPPWFNEGVAEYYQTLKLENDVKMIVGNAPEQHLKLLSQDKLIPFETFFNTDYYTLRQQGEDGAGLFFAQSWALMHFLRHGNGGARGKQTDKFLELVISGKQPREAFSAAFQIDYAAMEKELKNYIEQNSFKVAEINFKDKLIADADFPSGVLTEAQTKTHLGDLLFQCKRFDEAETYLEQSLMLNPYSSAAETSVGLVKSAKNKFDEAEKHLEKAIQLDPNNFLAYYQYARLLSRQGLSEFGFVSSYSAAQAGKMSAALKTAIALNGEFAPSYELYAFISAVRRENIDEAIDYLNRALKIAPGNQKYQIRMAELLMWKEDFGGARKIAQTIAKTAAEPQQKVYAENALDRINDYEGQMYAARNPHRKRQSITDRIFTEEELRILREQGLIESLNMLVAKPQKGEKRILGSVTGVECNPQAFYFTVKSENQIFRFKSDMLETVNLTAYSKEMGNAQFGCGEFKQRNLAVIVYRTADKNETKIAGELKSVEFVPANFRFLN